MIVLRAVELYLRARTPHIAPQTRLNIRCQLESFAYLVGPSLSVSRVTVRHVDKWMSRKPWSPATARTNLGTLRGWFEWMIQRGYILKNPALGYQRPRVPRRIPRELSIEDVQALFAVLPDARARLVTSLMVTEGLRLCEVTNLEPADVDTTRRVIHITRGKGGHERFVALSPDTASFLNAYLREYPRFPGQKLICSYRDTADGITAHYLCQIVTRWMWDAGIKTSARDGRSAHALRHTAAGAWLDDGADLRDVQEALGHANLATTSIYTKRRRSIARQQDFIGKRSYARDLVA